MFQATQHSIWINFQVDSAKEGYNRLPEAAGSLFNRLASKPTASPRK